jgi:hypothetical protein
MQFCAYHQIEHLEGDFNATQLKRKNSAWCRKALAENKRLKTHGLESNSKAKGKGGRPNWYTLEDLEKIQKWLQEGKSYSWIGRQYNPDRQAAVISKLAQEQGWQSQDALKLQTKFVEPESKVCTWCHEEKPIEKFPLRSDREDNNGISRYEAKCHICRRLVVPERQAYNRNYHQINADAIRQNKRDYRKRHPETHRRASHVRRATKNATRVEAYDERQIWESYDGLCYVCQKSVDFNKRGHEGDSFTLEHIVPIKKKGPTSYNNLAVSHKRCNSSKKRLIVPDVFAEDNYSVKEMIDKSEAYRLSLEKHYLHRKRSFSYVYGLYRHDQLMGFVGFSSPTSNRISKSVCPDDTRLVIELSRLWIDPQAAVNAGSWLISRALKMLPPYIVISYADSAIQDTRHTKPRNHNGLVYQATNFYFAGKTKPSHEYVANNSRSVTKDTPGAIKQEVSSKYRYWTLTGSKRDKKNLFRLCNWPILDPKDS